MRKNKLLLLALIFGTFVFKICLPLFFTDISPPNQISYDGHTSIMPKSLQIVEEEAFANTAIQILVFQEGLQYVESNAFSSMLQLQEIYFPASVKSIADTAFSSSALKIIRGIQGTYAQEWADRHGIAFKQPDSIIQVAEKERISAAVLLAWIGILCLPPMNEVQKIKQYLRSFLISMRPQDRAELHPIDYRFP